MCSPWAVQDNLPEDAMVTIGLHWKRILLTIFPGPTFTKDDLTRSKARMREIVEAESTDGRGVVAAH